MSVPVKHNLNRRANLAHPALARAKALRKFGGTMPANVQSVVDRFSLSLKRGDEQGTVATAATTEDTEWITSISVGTPAQTLPMDFDTGSSDLWVMGASTSGTSGHTTYNANTSTSAEAMSGATWTISYGDGSSSSGDVYTDVVTIGNLTVSQQAVEVATTLSSEFTSDTALSGLVGLAMSSINTVKPTAQQTWFDNIKSNLASPLFTADLKHGEQGSYNFGYIDSSAYTGSIYYADLVTSSTYAGFWSFVSNGYSVGSNTTTTTGSTAVTGIADTGTTLLMLPDAVVAAYYAEVSSAVDSEQEGGYIFSCDATLPDFTFNVGEGSITVPGEYLNFEAISTGSSSCYGGLQSDSGIGISIFGDVALKAALVVFDSGNSRLGWAAKASLNLSS
ncbi:aspartic peptidase domain-containing protein [Coniella lustricola]|uniref:Aspartic peptidase domain-containing protein n=1 Tax=Coniella lustricola TaxID=2025994 RepID=A0A2T3A2E6_9PEZI|nr:aspartic peptidase domain-containing protein [Coniella lustricola]